MTDDRSSSASSKRAEQLKRWEESDTNNQPPQPKTPSKIKFSSRVVFLSACADGEKDEVLKLLKEGADINTVNEDGLTALHQACINNDLKMVEFLVSHGADVNRRDNEGWTPLHATVSCGFFSVTKYLLENGADVVPVNNDGDLPVDITESKPISEILSEIIDREGIDCDAARNAERNTLMENAQYWAAHGYVDVKDSVTGGTPLHVAAAKGFIDIAKILLEDCGVDPDAIDNEGWTPLHAACHWAEKEAVTLLLKYGGNPHLKNFAGQNCADLVDPSLLPWLKEVLLTIPQQLNNNNNKRKGSPPKHDVKRVELKSELNDKAQKVPEAAPENKPPKGRPPSPDASELSDNAASQDDPPSWRRSVSFRYRSNDTRDKKAAGNAVDNETILRRTHSFENDKSFYQRYRDVTARIKASSCPSIPPPPLVELRKKDTNTSETNDDVQNRINPSERKEKDATTWNAQTTTTANTNPTITTTQTTVRRSFVPPVRDEESETQRKAHAKRVRETRRSTQGVTLDEIKSAEQLVKKRGGNGNGATDNDSSPSKKSDESLAANTDKSTFELEDAGRSSTRAVTANSADTTVTLPLRRPPAGSTANTTTSNNNEDSRTGEDKENNADTKYTSSPVIVPLSAVQRRRRPKRRCTGFGPVDMEDIVSDRGRGGEGDGDGVSNQSGTERAEDSEELDYKALYEASANEVRRLRALLATSEQQLREARATIASLSQVNQSSLSEIEKREKRAMERKLSEMEEELKNQQALQAENQQLKDENGALIRVISKLSK